MSDAGSTLQMALAALRLCEQGEVERGVQRYRDALARPDGRRLPVGLHAALLDGGGHARAAAGIRRAGMYLGLDLSAAYWPISRGNYAAALAEYRQCFDAGIATSEMFGRYLVCLSRLGLAAELAAMAAPASLFRRESIDAAAIDEPAWTRMAETLRRAPEREFQEKTRSVRRLDRVGKTHLLTDPPIVALHDIVRQRMQSYIAAVRASDHPVGRWLPDSVDLYSWAVIARGEGGYNVPHTHGGAWVVAVAYIEGRDCAEGSNDGALCVGPPTDGNHECTGWPELMVAPIPRTLVIMPGFYTHWTMPLRDPVPRMSVAFNAVDRLRDDDSNRRLQEIAGSR